MGKWGLNWPTAAVGLGQGDEGGWMLKMRWRHLLGDVPGWVEAWQADADRV
jgi:hypothetical protein